MITNAEIFERAQSIAARRQDRGSSFAKYFEIARAELQQPTEIKKIVKSTADDGELRKQGAVAQARRMPGVGSPDPDRRLEIGEVETALGRVRVAISRDSIAVHGVHVPLSDIDRDLREAIVETSASFAAATLDIEQSKQRSIVGFVVDAILRRHQFLTAKVKEAKQHERFAV